MSCCARILKQRLEMHKHELAADAFFQERFAHTAAAYRDGAENRSF
jgi:hypothetical protein